STSSRLVTVPPISVTLAAGSGGRSSRGSYCFGRTGAGEGAGGFASIPGIADAGITDSGGGGSGLVAAWPCAVPDVEARMKTAFSKRHGARGRIGECTTLMLIKHLGSPNQKPSVEAWPP